MAKIVKGFCKKCAGTVHFNIGDMTREEAEEALKSHKSWQCTAGNHVELMSPMNLYTFDWDKLTEDNDPMTEEKWYAMMKENHKEVYTTEELTEKYVVDSFAFGRCLCHSKDNEDNMVVFDFVHGPSGIRYYFA